MQWFDPRMAGWHRKGSAPRSKGTEKGRPLGEKREERREKREERDKHNQDEGRRRQWFGPRMAGWYRKGSVPRREEGRAQRKERREKREERDKHDQDK